MSETYRVEMIGIEKKFAGVHALSNGCLKVRPGEIHALVGENGAGKSTLMKVLAGAHQKDAGIVKIDGQEINVHSPRESMELGIATIYQEFMLATHLTVAENIFIDRLRSGKEKIINWGRLNRESKKLLSDMGFDDIDPRRPVATLTVAYQQVVEICKSLSRNAKVLVLDEPTAVLTVKETQKLFALLRNLKAQGVSIIYISHRMEEIFELCDRATVMKDGAFVGQFDLASITKNELIQTMVGRELTKLFPERDAVIGEEVLRVSHLTGGPLVQDISFTVRAGEVVGFYGLVGSGRTETMRTIFGADKWTSGDIVFFGEHVHFKTPRQAVKARLGMLPEDRKRQGVLLDQSIKMNTSITAPGDVQSGLHLYSRKKEQKFVEERLAEINTKYHQIEDCVSSLSGGNQQKVALAKWLAAKSRCIIFDEPTRGVDVGAKAEIYTCINKLAAAGMPIVIVSSEMPELIGMCDRVYVMRQGHLVGEFTGPDITENKIIMAAMGGETREHQEA